MPENNFDLILGNLAPQHAWAVRSGVTVFGVVVKRPYYPNGSPDADYEHETGQSMIETEKMAYQRLDGVEGILHGVSSIGPAILLPFMQNGDLHHYLETHPDIDPAKRLSWIRQMAHILARIHERRIIIADVASRNMLLKHDLSLVMSDFGLCEILPLEADIWTYEPTPFSYQSDIGEFGAVIYEIVTGKHIYFELCNNPENEFTWPLRDNLPSTEGLWLGDIIEACWTRNRFKSTHELCIMVDAASVPERILKSNLVAAIISASTIRTRQFAANLNKYPYAHATIAVSLAVSLSSIAFLATRFSKGLLR